VFTAGIKLHFDLAKRLLHVLRTVFKNCSQEFILEISVSREIYLMSKIKSIKAREILDSEAKPTVEVELATDLGLFQASVPSGVSRGRNEAIEIRDQDGGVEKAIENIEKILTPVLINKDPALQQEIDQLMIELDGTENKSNLGVNAILPLSLAVCRAGAKAKNIPLYQHLKELEMGKEKGSPSFLPTPCLLLIEGGLHAENDLGFQEFMVLPEADSFKEKFEMAKEVYQNLGQGLEEKYGESGRKIGLEGGFSAPLKKTKEALDLILEAIGKSDYQAKIEIILDAAASHFFKGESYQFEGDSLKRKELLDFYGEIIRDYPLMGIEDPFSEQDWEGFKEITSKFGSKLFIIGDDLLTSQVKRIKRAIKEKAGNGLILKPNQVGTVSETIEAAKTAFEAGWEVFVKHRGGETDDDFIADLAVGIGAKYIMAGGPFKKERKVKYERLLKIEQEL